MNTKISRDFKAWMRKVDQALERKVFMSHHDLPDAPYRDWFDSGISPKKAAKMALDRAGYGRMSSVDSLKDDLIKLGNVDKDLRPHIRPLLDALTKNAGAKTAKLHVGPKKDVGYEREIDEYPVFDGTQEIGRLIYKPKSYPRTPWQGEVGRNWSTGRRDTPPYATQEEALAHMERMLAGRA